MIQSETWQNPCQISMTTLHISHNTSRFKKISVGMTTTKGPRFAAGSRPDMGCDVCWLGTSKPRSPKVLGCTGSSWNWEAIWGGRWNWFYMVGSNGFGEGAFLEYGKFYNAESHALFSFDTHFCDSCSMQADFLYCYTYMLSSC